VHEDAVPAEDMPATGHLGRLETRLQANRALQFLLGVVDDLPNSVPLALLDPLEPMQSLMLVRRDFGYVERESQSPHETLLAIFSSVSASRLIYFTAL
jgi:hypothetical protein